MPSTRALAVTVVLLLAALLAACASFFTTITGQAPLVIVSTASTTFIAMSTLGMKILGYLTSTSR
ncbi:hypothetical protein ACFWXK_31555 [Streptomyces sp. NPDC059070]|uniref:hypothetical protein n=1 Tax=Streptomyces sp. NPDC059070 TaxID=3346713 RepID=UPI0036BD2A60